MTKEEMAELKRGDIVRHTEDTCSWLVTGARIVDQRRIVDLVRTTSITNPMEWEKFCKECGR